MFLALVLSLLIGASLGVLGGGGSILAVPILTYALHLDAKSAIASSLLIVAVTSAAALVPRARKGLVSLRTGLAFGPAAMVGAYAGGRFAAYVPADVLLVAFSIVMVVAGVRLLRGRCATNAAANASDTSADSVAPPPPSTWRMPTYGLLVGIVTGLVGAGGGFVVVPVLVLFGGLAMKRAIATSLLVIAMNAFAGFIAYTGHVHIDFAVVGPIVGMAVIGSVGGGILGCRLPQAALRSGFGWFVLAMAVFVLTKQIPPGIRDTAIYRAIFVERWPFWVGGIGIATVVAGLLITENKQLGVSTGCAELCALPRDPAVRHSWRPRFLVGIILGGAVATMLAGAHPTFAMGALDGIVGHIAPLKVLVLFVGGVLIGFGARSAGGCTSGHGIVGTALGARSSWIATALFMVAGFVTTNLLYIIVRG